MDKTRDVAGAIISLMKSHPKDFILSEGAYTLVHKPTEIEVWVSNGFFFFGVWRPDRIGFSLWDKVRFWFAYLLWPKIKTPSSEIAKRARLVELLGHR